MELLKKGATGEAVTKLQKLLCARGYSVDVDGDFGPQTKKALRAFQTQHLDKFGHPLVVDGEAGPLTWWSLLHPNDQIPAPVEEIVTGKMPKVTGASKWGKAALKAALNEIECGACEEGGNNNGKWVEKYINGQVALPAYWCAGFVSWCFAQNKKGMPFNYSVGAQNILKQLKKKGWAYGPKSDYEPVPGDIVVWWRESADSWKGHIGLVHSIKDGYLYTVEGNKGGYPAKVGIFRYVKGRMGRLLGFGHVPDGWQP